MKLLKNTNFKPSISLYKKIVDIEFTERNHNQLRDWIGEQFAYEYKEYSKETNTHKNKILWCVGFIILTLLNSISTFSWVNMCISIGLWLGYMTILDKYFPYKDSQFRTEGFKEHLSERFIKEIKRQNLGISYELIKELKYIKF